VLRTLVEAAPPVVAVSAVEAIADLDHPERGEALLVALSHSDTEIVKAAMQRLADTPDVIVRSHLTALLVHEAWDVRRLAADLLGRIGGEGTMARLRQSLAQEPEELVREAMQRALFELEARSSSIRRTTPPPVRGSSRQR
jgi:HEAT repeat protein